MIKRLIGDIGYNRSYNFGNLSNWTLIGDLFGFVQMDVVAFAHLAQILYIDKDTPYSLRDYMVENCPNLVGHCSRVKERCFPDWDEICSSLDMNTHLPKPEKQEEKEGKEEAKESKESKEEKEGDKEKADKEEKEVEKDKEVDENKEKEKDGK